ncbi:sigma-70 family RNA polymerase sigma factor [Gemmata sp. G18]|uniref:Sigma-70 family RNA polymerase sigma factor n=1 Tax=Gemmata palustris TaxID=2822762 RepID=A0ABS5BSS4_9BACT|nr:sigma-70 family RNA polymerase sigma factor [Gemmata palustris]MBP3956753.1 sigma-70 family RNA polymerase sigma factor [Gemmata palustris]
MPNRSIIAAQTFPLRCPPTSDAALLAAVIAGADEVVFEELVNRHGPMVLRVCRRTLGHHQDAEDAFQATFIVLLRRAARIGKPGALGSWLHGVAVRVSRELLDLRRRRATFSWDEEPVGPDVPCPVERDERAAVLHVELATLPPHYRAPVVLCELQGRSRREAAVELGIREGTLSSRLAKAKRILAERLVGKVPAGAVLGLMLGERAGALPVPLARRTLRLLVGAARGEPAVPAGVHIIANGVATAMRTSNLRRIVVAAALLVAGFSGLASAWPAPRPAPSAPVTAAAPVPPQPKPENRIWVRYPKTGKVVALTTAGRTVRELALKDEPFVLHVSPGTDRLLFAGREGRSLVPTPDGRWPEGKLTLHARPIDENGDGKDLGVEVNASSVLSPAGDTLGSVVMKQVAQVPPAPAPVPFVFENTLIDVATKRATKLDVPEPHQLIDIARDGTWVLTYEYNLPDAEKGTPPYRLHKVPVGGGKPRLLSGTLSAVYGSRISPDGTRVLTFAEDLKGKDRVNWEISVYVIDVGTGKAARIGGEKNQLWSYGVWSPDGKRVAYAWRERGTNNNANGSAPTRLVVCDADGKNAATVLTTDDDFVPVAWW